MHITLLLARDLKVDGVVVAPGGATVKAEAVAVINTAKPCLRIQYVQIENTPVHLRWSKSEENNCASVDSFFPRVSTNSGSAQIHAGTTAIAYVDESVSINTAK